MKFVKKINSIVALRKKDIRRIMFNPDVKKVMKIPQILLSKLVRQSGDK